ncbi:hypothetical protein ACFFGT_31150 [Mucilaginibacter angelicae]|uniref:Antitoxin component YwqK of YwqJK toxin-antitoxin module n=1 Tax=Mucilaginibacter angelicae TaxID=869718 RepID=A0ABV6LGU8_9SPHI
MKYFLSFLLLLVLSKTSLAQKVELINSGELINKAITLYDSSQHKTALKLLSKVNRSDTNYVRAVYEKAINCEADSQFTQAIKYCQEGLALKEQREFEPDFYNSYGNTLNDMKQPENAIRVFDIAIAKYPAYSLLYFNKGIALIALKRYADAEAQFQKTLLINPYMYSAHYQLGIAALQQGKIIPAFLSFTGYLLVNPQGKYWSKSINLLDKITKSTDDVLEMKNKRTGQQDEAYAEIEEIVLSKIALDKSYKTIISIDDPISRQMQAVFEKLEYKKESKDFWIQYYLPFYKQVYSQGKFEPFVFHAFSNVNIPSVQDYNKKNKKLLEAFVNDAAAYFNLVRATREPNFVKRDSVKVKYYFEDGKFIGKGTLINNGETVIGPWESDYPAGNKKSSGNYSALGKREGLWTYYFRNGDIRAKELFKDGKLNGVQEYYYENGNLSSRETYLNGVAEGLVTTYYYNGNMHTSVNYKLDKKEGQEKQFYENGKLEMVNNYTANVLNGLATEYFKSGKVKSTTHYAAGKIDGPYKSFYENGQTETEGPFIKDNAEGDFIYYYASGKVREKRHYIGGTEEGPHQEFYENGQLLVSDTRKKGKMDGEATGYYENGKVLSKYVYSNGVPKSANYINKAGNKIYAADIKSDAINIVSYHTDGYKNSHAYYNSKGDLDGPDTIFYPSGKINQINQYKDGAMNGLSVTYYLNGKIKSEVNVIDGKDDGYLTTFYQNGKPESEGWTRGGQHQGEWLFYDEGGKLSSRSYYLNDDLSGYKETYDPNGKKSMEEKYQGGWLEKLTQYDTLENVIAVDTFPKCSGKYRLLYPGGQLRVQGNYINGNFDGPFKSYYVDGSAESAYFYKKGSIDSTYVSYYYGGKKYSEGRLRNGDKIGEWKTYDEDGKLSSSANYIADDIDGEKTYFFETGTKDYIGNYKNGVLNGVSKKYDPDGSLAYQVNFSNNHAMSYSYLGPDGKLVPDKPIDFVNGSIKAYFQNGKLSRECTYSDGVKNGNDALYYSNGQVRSTDKPVYGTAEGLTKTYHPNGKPELEYYYVNDNPDGICKEYYNNGNLKKELHYINGVNHGPVKYFNETGKLIKTLNYYYGKLLSVKNE